VSPEVQLFIFIFFNIQINEILSLPLQSEIICYADDNSWEKIFKVINRDLQLIKQWLLENNLFLNFEKTSVILHALTENTLPIKKKYKNT
jgi:hypothetical protein